MYACMYVCVCVYIYIYIHTYIYRHTLLALDIHTHIHACIHTCIFTYTSDVKAAEKHLRGVLALDPNNRIGMREYAKLLFEEKSDCEAALWMLNRLEVCMHACMRCMYVSMYV
jgi:hypothetical protein